jgi:hypothetical protein
VGASFVALFEGASDVAVAGSLVAAATAAVSGTLGACVTVTGGGRMIGGFVTLGGLIKADRMSHAVPMMITATTLLTTMIGVRFDRARVGALETYGKNPSLTGCEPLAALA